ncbi:hypothetical protein [Streptomyces sp. NPDC047028]|uniref:hypothetical protein n=1 Tax=Streptomyces sp. NPDC047028 TaxID=3155793 RepID=UPI0034069DD7
MNQPVQDIAGSVAGFLGLGQPPAGTGEAARRLITDTAFSSSDRPITDEVIPIHQLPGWESLAHESWAQGWYALPARDGYKYCYSAREAPTRDHPGWGDTRPAPPLVETDVTTAPVEQVAAEIVDHTEDVLSALCDSLAEDESITVTPELRGQLRAMFEEERMKALESLE